MPTLDLEVMLGGENPEILAGLREPIVDSEKYPVLVRALENVVPANGTKIEADGFVNWQQIFRQPFAYKIDGSDLGEKAEQALEKLLGSIENTFVYGDPSFTMTSRRTGWVSLMLGMCGGVRYYLGRNLEPDDEIEMRPLRTPALYLHRGAADLFNDYIHEGEWICETSLYVKAKELQTA